MTPFSKLIFIEDAILSSSSNSPPPFHDSGYMTRNITRPFPQSESWKENDPKAIEFKEFLRINLPRLKALGDFRNWYILNHHDVILDEKRPEPLNLGLGILRAAFSAAGIEFPIWLEERLPENELEESMQENEVIVKRAFEKYIDEQVSKALQVWRLDLDREEKLELPKDVTDRLVKLAEFKLLPDIKYSSRRFGVFVGSGILSELYNQGVTKDQLPNLRALADYLKGEYTLYNGHSSVFVNKATLTKYFDTIEKAE